MKFKIEEWTIVDLINLYTKGNLLLDPPYQRNFIWTKKDQDSLIDSILNKSFPLPTFFLLKKSDGKYEMVDGQQRTRTIINYYRKIFETDKESKVKMQNFKLSITVITDAEDSASIEDFYARVNKTGKKLNKPELNKAQYFYTKYLELNEELAGGEEFNELDLFTENSTNRMNDVDFVSELVALLNFGLYDKKDKVDELYEIDLDDSQVEKLRRRFKKILKIILSMNEVKPINETRYSQRNDFFTLFHFIDRHERLEASTYKLFYELLVVIDNEISPSNDDCEPLKEYAINCVSQSNSKKAREKRYEFFNALLLNEKSTPNQTQKGVIDFYQLEKPKLIKVENFYTIKPSDIQELKEL